MKGPIPDNRLAAHISQEIQQAQNWSGSEWREAMRSALNYVLKRSKGDEVPGRSSVQSGDVEDMLDNVTAELQPMYQADELFAFKAEGPQDEEQVQKENEALNWYWSDRLKGYQVLDDAVQNALLLRIGYVKVWYEESDGLPYEETITGDLDQVSAVMEQLSAENKVRPVEVLEQRQAISATVEAIGPDGVTPVFAEYEVSPAVYQVKILIVPQHREVKSEAVAPEDMFISEDARSADMQTPRFVAHRRRMSKDAIKALGFDPDQVDRMPEVTQPWTSDIKQARRSDYNEYRTDAPDEDGREADLFECYYKIDQDGDGIVELRKVFWGGLGTELMQWADGTVANEIVRVRPFAAGQALKIAHRHQGRAPVYDKIAHWEDVSRTLIRQMLDNLYSANDQKTIIGPGVNVEDLEETEVGGYIRSPQGVQNVAPFPYQPIVGESLQALAFVQKKRTDAGGNSIESAREQTPVNQTAHTTERIMSAMEQMVAMYGRNLAQSLIRDIGVLLHQQMQLLPGRIQFQVGEDWREVEPRYWVQRNRLDVRLGPSMGEKLRNLATLEKTIEQQAADAQAGGMDILTDWNAMYQSRLDYLTLAGVNNPRQYLRDPASPEAQEAMAQRAQQAQEQQAREQQQAQAIMQTQLLITQMTEQTKRMNDQMDAIEADRDRMAKMVQEMTKLGLQHGVDLPMSAAGDPAVALRVVE